MKSQKQHTDSNVQLHITVLIRREIYLPLKTKHHPSQISYVSLHN